MARLSVSAAFARGLEASYTRLAGPRPCRLVLDPDLFDGRRYPSIEAFQEHCQPYFERPWDFYAPPAERQAIELRPAAVGPTRAGYTLYEFDSPFETAWARDNMVPFKWFRGDGKGIILFVPGWGRSDQSFEERMSRQLLGHGVDVGLLTVPFHQARAPVGTRSGEYFISANLFWTVANFRQLVVELRLLIQLMRERYECVGLLGMSSGAMLAGLASDCEPVDVLLSLVGGCDLAGITWHSSTTHWLKRQLERRGIDAGQLGRAWSIADQAVLGRHCRARFRKQYIARYDSIVPTEYQVRLWEAYGRPERLDLGASHVSIYFLLSRIVEDMGAFLRRCW